MDIVNQQFPQDIRKLSSLKTPEQILKMKKAGQICVTILNTLGDHIKPGATTLDLDKLVGDLMKKYSAELDRSDLDGHQYNDEQNAFFQINDVIARGMASDTPLQAGDIVSVDISLKKDGWCGDTTKM